MSIETNYGAANLRFTFALEIDGFPFRYYSHEAPARGACLGRELLAGSRHPRHLRLILEARPR
jgi:hypothetical protein